MINEELRPMTIGQLLDKTFRLSLNSIIKNVLTHLIFGGIMLGVSILTALIAFLVSMRVSAFSSNYEAIMGLFMIIIMLTLIPISIVWYSLLFDMQIKGYLNERWRLKTAFKPVLKKFWFIVGACLLSIPIVMLGYLALIIGVVGALALLSSVMPAILYEGLGPVEAIKRSFKLTGYSFWQVTGQVAIYILITFGILFLLNAARAIPVLLMSGTGVNSILSAGLYLVITALSLLYLAFLLFSYIMGVTFYTLVYFNQRIRYENFGMEVMAEEMVSELNTFNNTNNYYDNNF